MAKRRTPKDPEPPPQPVVQVSLRGVDEVRFLPHALDRMAQRGVPQQDVINALKDPDEENDSAALPGRKEVCRNKTALKRIKVVFEQRPDHILVITAMWEQRRLSGRD
jgi:hypothetical protein